MMHKGMCGGHKLAWLLLLIGGLNWGLIGVFDLNLVNSLFGNMAWLERLVYILVGASALMMLAVGKCCMKGGGRCKNCGDGKCAGGVCGPTNGRCSKCGNSPCSC